VTSSSSIAGPVDLIPPGSAGSAHI